MLFWKFQFLTTTVVLLALTQKLTAQSLTNNNANGFNVEPSQQIGGIGEREDTDVYEEPSVYFEDSEFPGFEVGDINGQASDLYQYQNGQSAMDSNHEFETSGTDVSNAAGNGIEERTAAAVLGNSAENAADANNGATDVAGAGGNPSRNAVEAGAKAAENVAAAAANTVGSVVDAGSNVLGGVASGFRNILNPSTPSGGTVDNTAENADETIQNPQTNKGSRTANFNVNSPQNVQQMSSTINQQGSLIQDSPTSISEPIDFDQNLSNTFVSGEQNYLNARFNDNSRQSGNQAFNSFQSQQSNDNSTQNVSVKQNSSSFNSNRQTSGHLTEFSQNLNLGDDVPFVHGENAEKTIQNTLTNTGAGTDNFNANSPRNVQQMTSTITRQGTSVQDSLVPQPIHFDQNLSNSFVSGQRYYVNAGFKENANQSGNQASDSFQSQKSDNDSNQNVLVDQNSSSSNSNRQSDGHLTEFSQNIGDHVPFVHRFRNFNHHRPIHSYFNGQPPFIRNQQFNV